MNHYAGIDVFLELSRVCILDASRQLVREAKIASEPEALATFLASLNLTLTRVSFEGGSSRGGQTTSVLHINGFTATREQQAGFAGSSAQSMQNSPCNWVDSLISRLAS
jgi:hypothetical protein